MHYIVKKKLFVKKIAIFVQQIFLDDHELSEQREQRHKLA